MPSVPAPVQPATHSAAPARFRPLYVELTVLAIIAAVVLPQLLIPPIVGLADNGDFARIMGSTGLTYPQNHSLRPPNGDRFVERLYSVEPYPWWRRPGYISSELIPVRLSLLIGGLVTPAGTFDLRVLGATHAVLFLLSAWLALVAARALGWTAHLALAAVLALVATDVGYFAYFNSMYTETAALISLYLLVGAALLLLLSRRPGAWLLVTFYAAALLIISAKAQMIPLAALLAPFGYWVQRRCLPRQARVVRYGLPLGLCAMALVLYQATSWNLTAQYLYNAVFHEILGRSANPERDLQELGLDPSLAAYAGTTPWDQGIPTTTEESMRALPQKVNHLKIAAFYLRHPARFLDLAERGATHAFTMRVRYLGTFEQSAGKPPGARSETFAFWSTARESLFPKTLPFVAGFLVASSLLYLDMWRRLRDTRMAAVPALLWLLVAMAAVQFVVVLLGEGEADVSRHLFLFNCLVDLCFFANLLWVGVRLRELMLSALDLARGETARRRRPSVAREI